MQLDPHLLHVAIRWVHVAAMATAFGGAVTVFVLSRRITVPGLIEIAVAYEWLFWAAAGLLVMTGIGNVAALGAGLSPPNTPWGRTLVVKLVSVLVIVSLSLPRSLIVASAGGEGAALARLRALYGATAGGFAIVLALAIWLAHG